LNRSLTPITELERRLVELAETATTLPSYPQSTTRSVFEKTSQPLSGILSSFDDQLEGLRLEASLLQSEDSPFTKRRRLREDERARKLADARLLAEAQFERIAREKELKALKAQRTLAEAERLLHESKSSSVRQDAESSYDEDWDPSIEYTVADQSLIYEAEQGLSIALDDSIFADVPSEPPYHPNNVVETIKNSLPPRPLSQVTSPPTPQGVPTTGMGSKQLVSLLKGLLPAKPRYINAIHPYVGSGFNVGQYPLQKPWFSPSIEINWQKVDLNQLDKELEGLDSLSLAPRAFSPASPLAKRTISLRLKSTDNIDQSTRDSIDDEFNLDDFEEHKDPELYEMHETYRALEEQVEDFQLQDIQLGADDLQLEPSFDSPQYNNIEDDLFDEGPDLATLDPDLPSVSDPFDVLEDLSFDEERLTSDFDWEGDTPTNVFGDEPTPTNVFGDDAPSEEGMQPEDELAHQNTSKGLFSRFFGRNK
jgi:hypothetical protein